jgi:outer membrane protein insertion porin family
MPVDPRTSDLRGLPPATGPQAGCAPRDGHLWRVAVVLAIFLGLACAPVAMGQAPADLLPPPAGSAAAPGVVPPNVPPPLSGPEPTRPQPPQAGAAIGAVDEANRIVEVRIEGNHATEVSKLPKLVTRAGQIFDVQTVEEDVRTLHRSRKFVDVRPKTVRVAEGVVVIFQVVERPMLRYVKYIGNERVTTRTLRKKAEIDVGDAMDPYVVEEARRRIESFYQEKGYDSAKVTTVEGSKPGDKGAVFLVDEGRSKKSLWTNFVGNTIASDARLMTQIKSKPGIFWLIGGEIDREKIDQDVDLITAYYRSLGFFQAKVGREVQVVHGGGRDWTLLTFVISEGPRYNVRNISFIGNSKFKGEFLSRDLKLKSGEPFNQSKMDADLGLIRDIYGGRGFVFADIRADPRFLEQPGELDLVYNVEEGQRYRVGKINVRIRGEHPHTRHSTILNRLSLRPGDILDIRKLRDDERRLKASSLFAADAAKGEGPRIVFSKPDEDDLQLARDPKRPGFRGQSPDGTEPEDAIVDLVLEGDLVSPEPGAAGNGQIVAPAPASPSPPASSAPPGRGATPVWRGQSPPPGYAPQAPYAQQPVQTVQPFGQPAAVQPGQVAVPPPRYASPPGTVPQPGYAAPPAAAPPGTAPWGGTALAPTGPESVDYGRTAAPQQPAYVAQQPVAPAAPPAGFQPGAAAPWQPQGQVLPPPQGLFPGQPLPPGFQPGVAGFADPPQVFPGQEPYVVVDVDAEETQTGRLMIGAGVNSNAGLVGNIVVDEQNFDITRLPRSWDDIRNGTAFRGAGQRFRLEAAPGTQLQRYTATFQEPYLFDTRIGLSTSASYYTRAFYDWAESRAGGRVGLGYQFAFAPDLSVNAGFRGESVNVFNPRTFAPKIEEMLGTNSVYGFSTGIVHDTRDSPFLPTQGHLVTFEFEQVIGTFVYPRGILEGRQYFLLNERPDGSGRHVLSVGSVLGMSGPDTPAYDNFYAGGYNTLRGFVFRGASPRQNGAIIGGPFQWLNTVEYLFPITADDTLRGVIFTDFGTVESNVSINQMRVAPGFGLRITLPAMGPAPIALDFAVPVVYAPYDSQQLFSFFVGFAR